MFIVFIPEGRIITGLEECVEAIETNHCLILVSSVQLLKNFGKSIDRTVRVFNSFVDNFNKLFGVPNLVTNSVIKSFILGILCEYFIFEQVFFPLVVPCLS